MLAFQILGQQIQLSWRFQGIESSVYVCMLGIPDSSLLHNSYKKCKVFLKNPEQKVGRHFIKLAIHYLNTEVINHYRKQSTQMSNQSQTAGQKDIQKQTCSSNSKPDEKIYNAFANILMKYQLSKTQEPQPSKNPNTQPQSSIITLDQHDAKTSQENVSGSLSKGEKKDTKVEEEKSASKILQKIGETKNNQSTERTTNSQKPKKTMKKSGKNKFQNPQIFTNEQKKQIFQSNPLKQLLKSKDNKKSLKKTKISKELQYVVQESQVEEINQTNKLNGRLAKANGKKEKKSKQIITTEGQFTQVIPKIVMHEDRSIVQLLKKKYPTQKNVRSPKMKALNFVVEVTLLPNKDIGIDLKKSKILNYIQNLKKSTVINPLSKSFVSLKDTRNEAKDLQRTVKQQKDKSDMQAQTKLSKNKEIYQQDEDQNPAVTNIKQKGLSLKNGLNQEKSQPLDKKLRKSRVQLNNNKISERESNNLSKSTVKSSKKQSLSKSVVGLIKKNQPINLGSASLPDLVDQLFKRKLISQSERNQFIKNSSQQTVKEYLNKFQTGKLHKFNFVKVPFTILDHRRLSQLLCKLFPQNYIIEGCSQRDAQAQKFLVDLYDISIQEYQKLCSKIDKTSKISWWGRLQEQSKKMMENQRYSKNSKKKLDLSYSTVKQVEQKKRIQSVISEKNKSKLKSKTQFTSIFDKELSKLYQSAVNQKSITKRKQTDIKETKKSLKNNRFEKQPQSYKVNMNTRSLRKNKLN